MATTEAPRPQPPPPNKDVFGDTSLELNSQKALLDCLRVYAPEQQGRDSAPSLERRQLAPPHKADGDEDDGGGVKEEEEEQGVALGLLLSMLAPVVAEEAHSAGRRAYSMEHFRWGKPTGRKRRPVKVYTGGALEELVGRGGVGEGSLESRRGLEEEEEEEEDEEEEEEREVRREDAVQALPTKLTYGMSHFRWSRPPYSHTHTHTHTHTLTADKRYGGFMKPWAASMESSHKPLLTLLRHVIAKDGQ
ncbi:pro-opiomelanocortin-like [Clupea harengus]|uniref:Pro-opiomelanocortin-like n=1 Tax=Clupea harengus TaxID=7950 RepID=A0A8M1KTP8_CLUHA|nr:pro-opiomelanocortin-like [Clupea harengus]